MGLLPRRMVLYWRIYGVASAAWLPLDSSRYRSDGMIALAVLASQQKFHYCKLKYFHIRIIYWSTQANLLPHPHTTPTPHTLPTHTHRRVWAAMPHSLSAMLSTTLKSYWPSYWTGYTRTSTSSRRSHTWT